MGEEIIGSDSLNIIANNQALAGGGNIAGAVENLRNHAFYGVSVFSTQAGTLSIQYRMAGGVLRHINGSPFVIAANSAFDRVFRKTREEYQVTYTDTSLVASNVDIETLRTNVN